VIVDYDPHMLSLSYAKLNSRRTGILDMRIKSWDESARCW